MLDILHYDLLDFVTSYGVRIPSLRVTYQLFGKPLGTAPVVVVNHAFTGNSQVAGENGWWAEAIGAAKVINTDTYTVVVFNIPGNGFHAKPEAQGCYSKFCAREAGVAKFRYRSRFKFRAANCEITSRGAAKFRTSKLRSEKFGGGKFGF